MDLTGVRAFFADVVLSLSFLMKANQLSYTIILSTIFLLLLPLYSSIP